MEKKIGKNAKLLIASDLIYNYRNKASFNFKNNKILIFFNTFIIFSNLWGVAQKWIL